MESNNMMGKTIGIIITAMVSVMIMASVLMPMTIDMSSGKHINEGLGYAKAIESTDASIDIDSDGTMTVNGTVFDPEEFPGDFDSYTLVYTDDGFVRWTSTTISIYKTGIPYNFKSWFINQADTEIRITGTEVVVSQIASSTTTYTYTLDGCMGYLCPDSEDYVLAVNPVVAADTMMCGAGTASLMGTLGPSYASYTIFLEWDGTVADGLTVNQANIVSFNYVTVDILDYTFNTSDAGNGLVTIDSILFDVDAVYSHGDLENHDEHQLTYTDFLVPRTIYYDTDYTALLMVIPLIVAVGVFLSIMRMFGMGGNGGGLGKMPKSDMDLGIAGNMGGYGKR